MIPMNNMFTLKVMFCSFSFSFFLFLPCNYTVSYPSVWKFSWLHSENIYSAEIHVLSFVGVSPVQMIEIIALIKMFFFYLSLAWNLKGLVVLAIFIYWPSSPNFNTCFMVLLRNKKKTISGGFTRSCVNTHKQLNKPWKTAFCKVINSAGSEDVSFRVNT